MEIVEMVKTVAIVETVKMANGEDDKSNGDNRIG